MIVAPLIGSRLATDENGSTAWPLMLSTVAPLNEELRCTPVALAVKLNATLLPLAVSLFPLMSMVLTSCAATWVRNGQPSMLTDGLALSPDDWIWLAMSFSAAALAIWSPMTKIATSSDDHDGKARSASACAACGGRGFARVAAGRTSPGRNPPGR